MLRDISELYAARLSPPAAAATATREKTPGSPPSPVKRLRPAEEAAAEGGGGAREEGGSSLDRKAALREEVPGEETPGGGGEAGRPAGDGSRNGGGSSPAGGKGGGGGGEGVLPAARPLRVFVSQGDVVYADEVEAVAIRRCDEATPADDEAQQCHACGERSGEENGTAAAGEAGGKKAKQSDATSAHAKEGGEDPSPAFFDPLLNPGSSGGDNQEGEAWSSAVVLLVPLRLGLDELSAGYIPSELVLPR